MPSPKHAPPPQKKTHTHTHTENAILIDLPFLEWFRERASMLRYTYSALLFYSGDGLFRYGWRFESSGTSRLVGNCTCWSEALPHLQVHAKQEQSTSRSTRNGPWTWLLRVSWKRWQNVSSVSVTSPKIGIVDSLYNYTHLCVWRGRGT
jgi:hypothetical protein